MARHRRENPKFDQFVAEAISDSNSAAQKLRWSRVRARAQIETKREESNDYYRILAMVPGYVQNKGAIVSLIFEDLLSGQLKREDVGRRMKDYVAAYDKMFPTKYAKFGNRPLVSLDEALFDDRPTTRGDTVTRGLWD